jgi:2-keto-4-pentenoate hydratase/2-oxohepta-3-ene-1,7-dioic acid hydratase in catechol pathway
MLLCRFQHAERARCGLLLGEIVLPLDDLASAAGEKYLADALLSGELERLFPIDSAAWLALSDLIAEVGSDPKNQQAYTFARSEVKLLPPIARPPKLLLLAGNYSEHVREQGDVVKEREETFPYVFMKPPSTTLVGDGTQVSLPSNSPDRIDHEVELAVVIGRKARDVTAAEALSFVAGYTIINDLSDRGFRPNPQRQTRPRDTFFDWLHGKWHDGFCPCGPCLATIDEIPDPQQLPLTLTVDGEVRQQGNTSQQIFSVAEVIEFVSSWVTLEPGDIISTGTPAGVGNATGKFLRAGQVVVASIAGIGSLTTHIAP